MTTQLNSTEFLIDCDLPFSEIDELDEMPELHSLILLRLCIESLKSTSCS